MSERWLELAWIIPSALTEILGAELAELGALGMQEDFLPGEEPPPRQPWEQDKIIPMPEKRLLKVWFPLDTNIEEELADLCRHYPNAGRFSWSELGSEDWNNDWKQHFSRFVVSTDLAIAPPWEAQEGDLVIEPGLAFGTGGHPTTLSCLKAISIWGKRGSSCLDIGCGTGILALAAAHLGMNAYGVDIEPQAVDAARENAQKNALQVLFDDTPIQDISGEYDIVVANLYAEVLVELAPHILPRIRSKLALAGILTDRVQKVKTAFCSLQLIKETQEGDWTHLWYQK